MREDDGTAQFSWDDNRDYYRKLLEPAADKTVVLLGKFAASNHGWFEGSRYRKGNVCFTNIRPFAPHHRTGLLCHHLNVTYEDLVEAGIHPGAMLRGQWYILAGVVRKYWDGRYGLQIDQTQSLPPVSMRGPFDRAYLRLAQAPGSYDFDDVAS